MPTPPGFENFDGQLAQLVRAHPSHGWGHRFESYIAHFSHEKMRRRENLRKILYDGRTIYFYAGMAELADAQVSEACGRKAVGVQLPLSAKILQSCFLLHGKPTLL